MKFLTLENGQAAALLQDGGNDLVVDLQAAAGVLHNGLHVENLLSLIEAGNDTTQQAWQLALDALANVPDNHDVVRLFARVKPLAPIPVPRRNIMCLGKNYSEHVKEIAGKAGISHEAPRHPIFFSKTTTCITGPDTTIPAHSHVTTKADYEAELALIIGKRGTNIPAEEAMDYVFGYTILNDVTARDLQADHLQWFKGKSLDGFAPMGPVITHHSVMPAAENIHIKCWVNGEQRQHGTLDELIFDIPAIISVLSAGMTLLPGDIIATGTPAGVGMGFKPARFLQPGDEIKIEITEIGILKNKIAAE